MTKTSSTAIEHKHEVGTVHFHSNISAVACVFMPMMMMMMMMMMISMST